MDEEDSKGRTWGQRGPTPGNGTKRGESLAGSATRNPEMLNDHLILRGPVFWSQWSTTSSGPAVSANGLNLAPRLLPRRFQTTSRESTRISANRPISISVIEVPTPNSLILSCIPCIPCIPWFQGSGAFLAGRGSWFVVRGSWSVVPGSWFPPIPFVPIRVHSRAQKRRPANCGTPSIKSACSDSGPELEAHEAADLHVLAGLGDLLGQHLLDRLLG